jgi:hypothetical protein
MLTHFMSINFNIILASRKKAPYPTHSSNSMTRLTSLLIRSHGDFDYFVNCRQLSVKACAKMQILNPEIGIMTV